MQNKLIKDFAWYFLSSIIPIAVGVIKTPIYTRHYSQADFGYLGIASVTYMFLSMMFFTWIASCLWRYFPKYKKLEKLPVLYTNITVLLLLGTLCISVFTIGWYLYEDLELMKTLIFYSALNIVVSQLYTIYMVVSRIEGKARFYTLVNSTRVIIGFLTVLILVFVLKQDIVALVLGLAIVDTVSFLLLVILNPSNISLSTKLINKDSLKELAIYGSAGLLFNVCFLAISTGDRYIIGWLGTIEEVGIYDQVYKISQLSITALVTVYINTINPNLLEELEHNYDQSKLMIRRYLQVLLFVGIPAMFYLSLGSKEIADLLLGPKFRVGYTMMPFIFFTAFLHGVSHFYHIRYKFSDRLKKLSGVLILGTIFNIVTTTVFVYFFNYKWAAVTSLLTYIFIMSIFYIREYEVLPLTKLKLIYSFKFFGVLSLQLLIYLILQQYISFNIISKIGLCLLFALTFVFVFKRQVLNLKSYIQ